MPGTQANEEFEEPARDRIPHISRQHVAAMERSHDDAVWRRAGMQHLLLTTVGRRSGREHKVALPFWTDPEGNRVVVASFAGAPRDPAWFLNLTDRGANPEVLVTEQDRSYWASAEVLEGAERTRIWDQLVADRPYYAGYQTRTDRVIPAVRLLELRSA